MNDSNRVIIEAWNTVLFEKFCRFRHLLVEGLSEHSDAALDRRRYSEGARVLDVGCGFGDSTLRIAKRVGPTGEAVGVDCAESFIRAAEAEARQKGVDNARFVVGDAQGGDLRGPYDHAFARFGTMFFEMAGLDMVSTMLRGAGFERVTFERYDCDICIGSDIDDAIEFAMALGPAGEIIRLAGAEGAKRKPQVVAALKETFASFARPDGIWAPSSTWFITATNPG